MLDYYAFGSIMPGRNSNSGDYRYGYQGSEKDDEITGVTGSHITTFFREYDLRLVRTWSLDPKRNNIPWQSPYVSMDNNPILYNDILGDSSEYYGPSGDLLHVSTDNLQNAVTIIPQDNLEQFKKDLASFKESDCGNCGMANKVLRTSGVSYATDDLEQFFEDNNADVDKDGYIREHKSYLYISNDGLIRRGAENIQGRAENVTSDDKDVNTGKQGPQGTNPVGQVHTHPNVGKPANSPGSYYSDSPSNPDHYTPYNKNQYHDAIVSPKSIWFLNSSNRGTVKINRSTMFGRKKK